MTAPKLWDRRIYVAMMQADACYSAHLERCYGKRAGDRRYQCEDHADAQCQAARVAYRAAAEAWHKHVLECRAGTKEGLES
jgi:hypothetical protein